jgi:hypothetical protein
MMEQVSVGQSLPPPWQWAGKLPGGSGGQFINQGINPSSSPITFRTTKSSISIMFGHLPAAQDTLPALPN